MPSRRLLILVSNATEVCGVEGFSRNLAAKLGARGKTHVLDFSFLKLFQALNDVDALVLNFPIVAWKKKLAEPVIAAATTRLKRKRLTVVLHEWEALNWKRRVVLAPVVFLAQKICFSAPEIAAEFSQTMLSRVCTKKRSILPVPPNLVPPVQTRSSAYAELLAAQKASGRLLIGQFGSIYPKKQSTAVLEVASILLGRGHDVGVSFVGSFIRGQDSVENDFNREVERLNLSDRVSVSGYVASDEELFGIFKEIDVFCYLLPDGLTARRASVLAASFSGKPVVVNAARSSKALAHHVLFQKLIAQRSIQLVPLGASAKDLAEAVLKAKSSKPTMVKADAELKALWKQIIAVIDDIGS